MIKMNRVNCCETMNIRRIKSEKQKTNRGYSIFSALHSKFNYTITFSFSLQLRFSYLPFLIGFPLLLPALKIKVCHSILVRWVIYLYNSRKKTSVQSQCFKKKNCFNVSDFFLNHKKRD